MFEVSIVPEVGGTVNEVDGVGIVSSTGFTWIGTCGVVAADFATFFGA